jgi:hypothetical protein
MATTTNRVYGTVGTEDGGIYSPGASLAFYKITVKDASAAAVDLRAESEINEAIELVVRTVPAIVAYDIANATSGIIHVITDGVNAWPASLLQTALRALGTSIGTNGIDVSGTVVEAGLGFTVSSTAV